MDTQEMFKEKYLKYKEKYLKLKELEGGVDFDQVKADALVNSNLNKLNNLNEQIVELKETLKNVIQKEILARDAVRNDRDDRNLQTNLSIASKTTSQVKMQLEKTERAAARAGEEYRKAKKVISEQLLKFGENTVLATKKNLDKAKMNLEKYKKLLRKAKESTIVFEQKIVSIGKAIENIKEKLVRDEENLRVIENEQLSKLGVRNEGASSQETSEGEPSN